MPNLLTTTNTMLSTDLIVDPATAITAGTANSRTFSLLGGGTPERTVRSVASLANTQPYELSIGHLKRKLKGFKSFENASVPAPDVTVDRHTVRLDYNMPTDTLRDPDYRLKLVTQLTIELPRLGITDTPTTVMIADSIKALASMLLATSNANLLRLLNHES